MKSKTEGIYTREPENKREFTNKFDLSYTRWARIYDIAVKFFPFWKTWLKKTLPHISGKKILEVSFGTGYLLSKYAGKFETQGIEYNRKMIKIAQKNLKRRGIHAELRQGDVECLPYEDEQFDCIINTMAFSGYPDGKRAMSELNRVLKPGGKLILVDFNFPSNKNKIGTKIVRIMERAGDIIRDMDSLFSQFDLIHTDQEIGAFGAVHLFIVWKNINKKR